MSGKSYTLREMKVIVDHLVETKAYNEIKGRKMWVDFANTKLTTRTWQSLKETFLKRILPDIHNPYYKLTVEQINSFRAGYDVKDKNKLEVQEVQTLSDSSNSNGGNLKNDNKKSNSSSNEAENTAGENIKCSKIPSRNRSSADTVIVDNCYESAEAIQNVLESPKVTNNDKTKDSTSKSLRDCITYSEPLTPMLQEVLDDFASESESENNPLQIVENNVNKENEKLEQVELNEGNSEATEFEGNTEATTVGNVSTEVHPKQSEEQTIDSNTVDESIEKISTEEQTEDSEVQIINNPKENGPSKLQESTNYFTAENGDQNTNATTTLDEINSQSIIPQSKEINSSNSTADASLPNNPEALNNQNKTVEEIKDSQAISQPVPSRKRANTGEQSTEIKKKKLDRLKLKTQAQNNTEGNTPVVNDKSPKVNLRNPKVLKKSPKLDTNKEITEKVEEDQSNNDIVEVTENSTIQPVDKSNETAQSAETTNPCLQNVSLFGENLNSLKYDSSDSSNNKSPKKVEVKPQNKETAITQEVVVLRSHTDSDTEEIPTLPIKNRMTSSKDRDRILANVFGFTSGAVGPRRKRQLSRRRRTISHNNISRNQAESDSSQWTSESDSDMYVSPPRGRKNRTSKKYLRPHSAKVMSLEEEGGLFVMYGKKIYPLVKDGKIVKNYLTYLPDSASENEEDYWKLKYVEEKKRTDELKKLLEKSKQPESPGNASPILPNPSRASRSSHKLKMETNTNEKEISKEEKKPEPAIVPAEKIKIKFTKNNEELHLEGHWPQIHPVLEQVVQIFHKESETAMGETKPKLLLGSERSKESSSRASTPVVVPVIADVDVHQKIDKIEDQIFKEIEERDKEEEKITSEAESNVTKRKGRLRKSSSVPASPAKRQKTEKLESTSKPSPKQSENKIVTRASRKSTKSPKHISNESTNTTEQRTIQTRRSKGNVTANKTSEVSVENDVRYMLPPKANALSPRRNTRNKPQKR